MDKCLVFALQCISILNFFYQRPSSSFQFLAVRVGCGGGEVELRRFGL